jgi:methanethiol S-methyltransferase
VVSRLRIPKAPEACLSFADAFAVATAPLEDATAQALSHPDRGLARALAGYSPPPRIWRVARPDLAPSSAGGFPVHFLIRAFAVVAYLAFVASFTAFAAFVCGAISARDGAAGGPLAAIGVDVGLVALFGVTHSVMARQGFKRVLTRVIPTAAERSLFVLVASAQLALLTYAWRPLPGWTVWAASGPAAAALSGVQVVGFGIALVSSFLIDHFELFGLRQAFSPRPGSASFRTPALYRHVRHPLYLGFIIAFWSAPRMSVGRLCLAVAFTAYVLVAIRLEERDLVRVHGERYRRYQRDVPMLIPAPAGRVTEERVAH